MKTFRTKLLIVVGIALALASAGCPPGLGPAVQSVEDTEFGFYYWMAKDIYNIFWYKDQVMHDPSRVDITFPTTWKFNGFAAGSNGRFKINTDMKGPIEYDFNFVRDLTDSSKACIDFNGSGGCNSDEPYLMMSGSNRMIFTLPPPYQCSNFAPGLFDLMITTPRLFDVPLVNFASGLASSDGEQVRSAVAVSSYAHDIVVNIRSDSNQFFKYLVLLINAQLLPHIPFGTSGSLTIVTQVVVNNPNAQAVDGQLDFFKQDGSAMNVKIGSKTSNQHTFTVPAQSSIVLETDPSGVPVQIGWGYGTGSQPLEFSLVFATYNGAVTISSEGERHLITGSLRSEAGISAGALSTNHVLSITKTADGIDSAFAIVNPTQGAAKIKAIAKDATGVKGQTTIDLAPRSQIARFWGQFFGLNPSSFSGTLVLQSNTHLAVTSLKTYKEEQSSSLPSGTRRTPGT
ncbi:MAG: hypothetical protein HY645_00200 [Acidobacteria bacterium]|nr:hypothetical protein [Acidobacteriota bacterium]